MIRTIVHFDKEKCNGCGLCANACQEGAIGIVNGKAKLLRDDYCDGLGNCLPACPTNAISFVEREAAAFDEEAVKMAMAEKAAKKEAEEMAEKLGTPKFTGCPGSMARAIERKSVNTDNSAVGGKIESELRQWPVQIKLAPIRAPYFDGANLLIAADCTAYAYGDFHRDFVHNRKVLIGCPKLDEGDYTEKLTEIIRQNDIKSLTIVRMQVPCCGGLEHAAVNALKASGKFIPWQVKVIATDGSLVE